MSPIRAALLLALVPIALLGAGSSAQVGSADTRGALTEALAAQRFAAARAARLEAEADRVTAAADRTARQSAALAARVQQAEAGIAAGEARLAAISGARERVRARLAERQAPLVRLTGALQLMARRPLVLAALQPGSLRDVVHVQAVIAGTLPVIRARTAGLRAELERFASLQNQARLAQSGLRAEQGRLAERRRALTALETRQRLASRAARGSANQEQDQALALVEEARDLTTLVGELERAGALRHQLAALPGPVLRPGVGGRAATAPALAPAASAGSLDYILPVAGRLVTGFGEASGGGALRAQGITLAPRAGAQVVAPAAGRVAFAGAYAGYGRIAIVEHPGGWTTLITNLAAVAAEAGDTVVQGAPLGRAGPGRPTVTVELRKDGRPVDVLAAVHGR